LRISLLPHLYSHSFQDHQHRPLLKLQNLLLSCSSHLVLRHLIFHSLFLQLLLTPAFSPHLLLFRLYHYHQMNMQLRLSSVTSTRLILNFSYPILSPFHLYTTYTEIPFCTTTTPTMINTKPKTDCQCIT